LIRDESDGLTKQVTISSFVTVYDDDDGVYSKELEINETSSRRRSNNQHIDSPTPTRSGLTEELFEKLKYIEWLLNSDDEEEECASSMFAPSSSSDDLREKHHKSHWRPSSKRRNMKRKQKKRKKTEETLDSFLAHNRNSRHSGSCTSSLEESSVSTTTSTISISSALPAKLQALATVAILAQQKKALEEQRQRLFAANNNNLLTNEAHWTSSDTATSPSAGVKAIEYAPTSMTAKRREQIQCRQSCERAAYSIIKKLKKTTQAV
jgi:hypothetical protein